MAKSRYSEALQDAFMLGDLDKIAELKQLIAEDVNSKKTPVKRKDKVDVTVYANTILNNDQAPVMKIQDFMVKNYGVDWAEDEIETIDRLLWLDHGTVLDGVNRDKVLALRHIQTNFNPYIDWFEFNQVATSLGGAGADFLTLIKPTPGMLINAVRVMEELKGDEDWSADVINYITITLINEGIYTPPPSIAKLVAESMTKMTKSVTSKTWGKVEKKLMSGTIDETAEGIQAKRIIVAESAAKKYFK